MVNYLIPVWPEVIGGHAENSPGDANTGSPHGGTTGTLFDGVDVSSLTAPAEAAACASSLLWFVFPSSPHGKEDGWPQNAAWSPQKDQCILCHGHCSFLCLLLSFFLWAFTSVEEEWSGDNLSNKTGVVCQKPFYNHRSCRSEAYTNTFRCSTRKLFFNN